VIDFSVAANTLGDESRFHIIVNIIQYDMIEEVNVNAKAK